MIPVTIVVFDEKTKEEIDIKLVGCYSVPQINEIIAYGETRLHILGVRHTFVSPSGFLSQTIEIAAQECSE